jgi:hypothetical protein
MVFIQVKATHVGNAREATHVIPDSASRSDGLASSSHGAQHSTLRSPRRRGCAGSYRTQSWMRRSLLFGRSKRKRPCKAMEARKDKGVKDVEERAKM